MEQEGSSGELVGGESTVDTQCILLNVFLFPWETKALRGHEKNLYTLEMQWNLKTKYVDSYW